MQQLTDKERSTVISALGTDFTSTKLAGDASTRIYYRALTENKSYIICKDDRLGNSTIDDFPFLVTQKLFFEHINVPRIISVSKKLGLIIQEDCGDTMLETYIQNLRSGKPVAIYKNVLDDLIKIQLIPNNNSLPFTLSFDTEKLMFEFNFFLEHFVKKYKKIKLDPSEDKAIHEELLRIAGLLQNTEDFVLTHRDFHSRNIMIKNDKLYYIDFQDARLGLPHYDLVSLLRDCYYTLPEESFTELKDYYYTESINKGVHSMKRPEFDHYFEIMGFQRSVKALGSFAYLTAEKSTSRYEASIPATIQYIINYSKNNSELKNIYNLFKNLGIL